MILDDNIEKYILELCIQAENLMPEDISITNQREIISTIYNFLKIAYDALSKEDNLNHENVLFIMQLLGEWVFHKGIDMKRAGMEEKYIQKIQQKLAFVIYEISKVAIEKNLTEGEIIQIVEHHVKKCYDEEIKNSFVKGDINFPISKDTLNNPQFGTMVKDENSSKNTNSEEKKDFYITINVTKSIHIILEILGHVILIAATLLFGYIFYPLIF